MKAHERSFVFMSMPSYYDIPFFQRAYVWDEENWQELLNSFLDQTESHFLGSIILKQESAASGSYPHFMIIDGQQRLTTLSILARACYDCLMENADQYDEAVVRGFDTDIHSLLFIKASKFAAQEDVKIQHSKLDAPAFQDVINGKYVDCLNEKGDIVNKYKGEDSKIVRCYLFFRKELHSYPLENVQKIWSLLTEENPKYLVNIDLAENENEQKIFDTVNSFGVRLSSSDTIKNTLFQTYIDQLRLKGFSDVREEATELYNATWEKSFEPDDETKGTISEAFIGRDYSQFSVGQRVVHVSYTWKRPANEYDRVKYSDYGMECPDEVDEFEYVTYDELSYNQKMQSAKTR